MEIVVNNKIYQVVCLLGKGKGGYSYLVSCNKGLFVVKQIHHEPCEYYQFGNKIESEVRDYNRLHTLIRMPKLLDVDYENECILKEYICGKTIQEIANNKEMKEGYYQQIENMCAVLYANGLNIDYYPSNFVVQDDLLYYVDYECNAYMEKWDYEHWGKQYWK